MALIPKFNIATPETADSLTRVLLYDTRGIYDPITNPNGYNSPNPSVSDITGASLTMLPYLSTDPAFVIDVFQSSVFPNTNNIPATILNTDLGFSADQSIPSGIYYATYAEIFFIIFSTSQYVYLDAVHQCCADKMLVKARKSCDSDLEKLAISLQAKIDSVHALISPNCNEIDAANDIVQQITSICNQNDCGCGCGK